jgi:hypothetical protein
LSIPKVIHYCWFGKSEKPILVKKCIDSWKELCPDYEIIEWNEDNFDVTSNQYTAEAYANKKWAFVTDFVRLYVLYNYGGIYMDSDVQLVKNIDPFLTCPAFSGFESNNYLPTAIMGAEKSNRWIKYLLDYYYDKHFVLENGSLDLTTNTNIITKITLSKYTNVKLKNKYQETTDFILFPSKVFCPKKPGHVYYKIYKNTFAVHHFNGSWIEGNRLLIRAKFYLSPIIIFVRKFKKKG